MCLCVSNHLKARRQICPIDSVFFVQCRCSVLCLLMARFLLFSPLRLPPCLLTAQDEVAVPLPFLRLSHWRPVVFSHYSHSAWRQASCLLACFSVCSKFLINCFSFFHLERGSVSFLSITSSSLFSF